MIDRQLEEYITGHIGPEDELLKELDRETNLKVLGARMLSGHLQGKLLTMISNMIQAERILEVGTYTGYSAICLARGMKQGGRLFTIEINDELKSFAVKYIDIAGLGDQIVQLTGHALDIIPTLDETFDLVFLDADKKEYTDYYNLVFDKLRTGGIILADNTLWSGKVLDEPSKDDEQTAGVIAFNEMIAGDNRVEKVIIPLRDGITIIRKK